MKNLRLTNLNVTPWYVSARPGPFAARFFSQLFREGKPRLICFWPEVDCAQSAIVEVWRIFSGVMSTNVVRSSFLYSPPSWAIRSWHCWISDILAEKGRKMQIPLGNICQWGIEKQELLSFSGWKKAVFKLREPSHLWLFLHGFQLAPSGRLKNPFY